MLKIANMLKNVIAGVGATSMLAAGLVMAAPPAMAATTTLNSVTLSSDAASATSVSAIVSFKTATTGTVKTVVVAMPNFSGASPTVSANTNISAGTVASSGSGATYAVTYTVTTPASISSATQVSFTLGALTNPGSTGNQSITITTQTSAPATIDSGKSLVSIIANASTTVTTTVSQAITASVGACSNSCGLTVDPSGTANTSDTIVVSVATNAKNGVTTTLAISGTMTGTAYNSATIPAVAGTFASPTANVGKPTVDTWGVNVDGTSNTWAGPTTAAQTISGLSTAGPTNSISQTHAVGVNVDYLTPADAYTTSLLYVFTPNF